MLRWQPGKFYSFSKYGIVFSNTILNIIWQRMFFVFISSWFDYKFAWIRSSFFRNITLTLQCRCLVENLENLTLIQFRGWNLVIIYLFILCKVYNKESFVRRKTWYWYCHNWIEVFTLYLKIYRQVHIMQTICHLIRLKMS